jgi:hypothetical protein
VTTIEIVEFRCPYCGHILGEEEAKSALIKKQKEIAERVEQKIQQQIKELQIGHAKEISQLEKKYAQNVETLVNSRMGEERVKWANEELKHKEELAQKESAHKRELEETITKATNFSNERVRQAIAEKEDAYRQKEEQYRLRVVRLDDDNKKLQLQIEEQRKRLNSVPGELGGTAGENVLFDSLKKEFKTDIITCKKNGVAMADIVQIIVTEKGRKISTPIVYDKKTSRRVTKADLEKAKNYKRIHKTDHCIIVTNDICKENRLSETREGILLARPMAIVDIADRIRESLIEVSKQEKVNGGRNSKKDKLYKYFTSAEYNREVLRRIEVKSKLDEIQLDEEEKHRKWWNRRREFIREWIELDTKQSDFITNVAEESGNDDSEEHESDGINPSA